MLKHLSFNLIPFTFSCFTFTISNMNSPLQLNLRSSLYSSTFSLLISYFLLGVSGHEWAWSLLGPWEDGIISKTVDELVIGLLLSLQMSCLLPGVQMDLAPNRFLSLLLPDPRVDTLWVGYWVDRLHLGYGRMRLGQVTELLQCPQSVSICQEHQQAWVLLGLLVDRVSGRLDKQGWSWVHRSQGYFQVHSWHYITGVRPDTWVQTCLIKVALLNLGFHWDFATSYLDPKVSPKGIFAQGWLPNYIFVRGWGWVNFIPHVCWHHSIYNFKYSSILVLTKCLWMKIVFLKYWPPPKVKSPITKSPPLSCFTFILFYLLQPPFSLITTILLFVYKFIVAIVFA